MWMSAAVLTLNVLAQDVPSRTLLPPPGAKASSSSNQIVSPVTLMTWITRYGGDGVHELELLVLWRGTPGWFLRSGSSGGASGGSQRTMYSIVRYGGLELNLDLDFQKRVARIQGREVVLDDANVILVDDVDTGPRVAGTLRIDPYVPVPDGQHPDVEGILRRSADIISFVRCDTPMPDGKGQAMFEAICARVLGKQ